MGNTQELIGILGKYDLTEEISSDGLTSTIYKGIDTETNEEVAIKVIKDGEYEQMAYDDEV